MICSVGNFAAVGYVETEAVCRKFAPENSKFLLLYYF